MGPPMNKNYNLNLSYRRKIAFIAKGLWGKYEMTDMDNLGPQDFLLGVPVAEFIEPATVQSIVGLIQTVQMPFIVRESALVEINRTRLLQDTLDVGAKFLIMTDTDMTFTPQDIDKLLQVMQQRKKAGLVAGIAISTNTGMYNVGWRDKSTDDGWIEDEKALKKINKAMKEGSYLKADTVGTGVCVVRAEAIKTLDMPFCYVDWDEKEGWRGEDHHLTKQLQDKGWETYMHFGVKLGHIGKTLHLPHKGKPLVRAE